MSNGNERGMTQVRTTLPADLLEMIDAYARQHKCSRSTAIRELLARLHAQGGGGPGEPHRPGPQGGGGPGEPD